MWTRIAVSRWSISKYAPHGQEDAPFVDSRFYSTVSVIRTMETLLGLPPMNNNDAFSSMISSLFTGQGDQPAFTADTSNRDNGLIYAANKRTAPGAQDSLKMDFRHADRADTQKLNLILWRDAMGDKPVPASLRMRTKSTARTDDDDKRDYLSQDSESAGNLIPPLGTPRQLPAYR